jgi:hypothetical protein
MNQNPYNTSSHQLFPPNPQFETPTPISQQHYLPTGIPNQLPTNFMYNNQTETEKSIGKKIKKAFLITVLFIIFMNSFIILDNVYFAFTQKQFEFIKEDTGNPTIKGYFLSSTIVFLTVLWLIWK